MSVISNADKATWPQLPGRGNIPTPPALDLVGDFPDPLEDGEAFDFTMLIEGGTPPYITPTSTDLPPGWNMQFTAPDQVRFYGVAER